MDQHTSPSPGLAPLGPNWARPHKYSHGDAHATEWLLTNGLGGYACGTVGGITTRAQHGLLTAALPPPHGRVLVLAELQVAARTSSGDWILLTSAEPAQGQPQFAAAEVEFWLELGCPCWRYRWSGGIASVRMLMPHQRNAILVNLTHEGSTGPVEYRLRPHVLWRPLGQSVAAPPKELDQRIVGNELTVSFRETSVDLTLIGQTELGQWISCSAEQVPRFYQQEREQGYDCDGEVWAASIFQATLQQEQDLTLAATVEPARQESEQSFATALAAERARKNHLIRQANAAAHDEIGQQLVLAADQFLIQPVGRDEAVNYSIIAGYPWFGDWGRDTMISLPGLTLTTRRFTEAREILRTFGRYFRNGLLPNLFQEGNTAGDYNTADATLWYFHAIDQYQLATGDWSLIEELLPVLLESLEAHTQGTDFGIGVDPADGLLSQGAEGLQLTWMDAKLADWVVTPRRGKAVEINALWFNALQATHRWLTHLGRPQAAERWQVAAEQAQTSFNARFWNPRTQFLFDVVDGPGGDDPACRPNQLFAVALPHAVLAQDRWAAIVNAVGGTLLTPYGLRSLSPKDPAYQPHYGGSLRDRDAAYHQGTVWSWLIGAWCDAWIATHPGQADRVGEWLAGLVDHLGEGCVGQVAEIFSGATPHPARGCFAQAWGLAELLRQRSRGQQK